MNLKRCTALLLAVLLALALIPAAQAYPSVTGCRASSDGRHSWQLVSESLDCLEPGLRVYRCEYCGARAQEEIPPSGHNWVQRGEIDYTGCTSTAYVPYVCTRCGETKVEQRPGPGHDWSETGRSTGDCVNGGAIYYECRRCGQTKTEPLSPTGKHTFGDWKTDEKPTCTKQGLEVRKCTVCGKQEWRYIKMLEHAWGDWQEDPANPGKMMRTCKMCGTKDQQKPDDIQPPTAEPILPVENINPAVTASSRVAADAGEGKKYEGAVVNCELVFTNTGNVQVYLCIDDQEIWNKILAGNDPPPHGLAEVKNPLALGKTTGALLLPGEKISWPYEAVVDAEAAETGFLGFGFTLPFQYDDVDGITKSASSSMGFVGVTLTGAAAAPQTLSPAVAASGRWQPDAGEGKRYVGAEVAYEIVFQNTGDTPVYICYDVPSVWDEIQHGNDPAPHGLSTVINPLTGAATTGALLNPGEKLSRPVTDVVDSVSVETGTFTFQFNRSFVYEDTDGQMKSGTSSTGEVKIPLTEPEAEAEYDKVNLQLSVVMTSAAKASYQVGDKLIFQVSMTNMSSFDMITPHLRGDTLYDDGFEYTNGVDIRGYSGETRGHPKLPVGDTFTVEDSYTIRQVDVERGHVDLAWRGFGYPDYSAGGPSLPPEWAQPETRPIVVQWNDAESRAAYFRTDSYELSFPVGDVAVYDKEDLRIAYSQTGVIKSEYVLNDQVEFDVSLKNYGTIPYTTPVLMTYAGDPDSDTWVQIQEDDGTALAIGGAYTAHVTYQISPVDAARGCAYLMWDGYAVYDNAHMPSFPPEEEHFVDYTGAERVVVKIPVKQEKLTEGLMLSAMPLMEKPVYQVDDVVGVVVELTNIGTAPLTVPCVFIDGECCMAQSITLPPDASIGDVVFVQLTADKTEDGIAKILVQGAAWPEGSSGAAGTPWLYGITGLSADAVMANDVAIAMTLGEQEEAALAINAWQASEYKSSYAPQDKIHFEVELTNVGKTSLEAPSLLLDYGPDDGVDDCRYTPAYLAPGESIHVNVTYVVTDDDAGRGELSVTMGGQAWKLGTFDGTYDDYSSSPNAVCSGAVNFTLPVSGGPGPIPKPKGEPKLTLYVEPKYPSGGYYLDEMNQTEEIPYILTVVNDGDAPFEFVDFIITIGGTVQHIFPGLGVLYPHDFVDYTLEGTRLVLGDILAGTEEPGVRGIVEVKFQYEGCYAGSEEVALHSNVCVLEHVILDEEPIPGPIPDPEEFTVVKTEISKPLHDNGYLADENIVYQIEVTNHTGFTISDVYLYDILADDGYGSSLIGVIHDMEDGETRTDTFIYTVTPFDAGWGYVKNKAYVEWIDPATSQEVTSYSNNVFSTTDEEAPESALTLVKSVVKGPENGEYYVEGEQIIFQVDIDNPSSVDLENVFVKDPLIPMEELGSTLAGYSEVPAGFHDSVTFEYTVTQEDAILGSISNAAYCHVQTSEGEGYDVFSNEVTVLTGVPSYTFSLLAPLEVIKEEVSKPLNGSYYEVSDTIQYSITVRNPNTGASFTDIDVMDVLAPGLEGLIDHIDVLGPGEEKVILFAYTVTEEDLPAGQVANRASIRYHNAPNLIQGFQMLFTAESDWVYSKVGKKPPTPPRRTPQQADCCELTLTAHGTYALDYSQHYCAEHAALRSRLEAEVLAARTETDTLRAWQAAGDSWREELDKLYMKCLNEATGTAKAAVMDDRSVFYLYLGSLEEVLNRAYADHPEKVAKIIAEQLQNRCTELCYVLHKAPGARRDSLITGRYDLLTGSMPMAHSLRTEMSSGKNEALIHLALSVEHGRVEETVKRTQEQAVTRAQHAQAFADAQSLWKLELSRACNTRCRQADEAERQAIALLRMMLDRMLEKRAAFMQSLYPNQPDTVAETTGALVRDLVIILSESW